MAGLHAAPLRRQYPALNHGAAFVVKGSAYKRYMLVVLLIVMAFNNVDRLALGLLLQDIKADLSLSDTQLGLLTGIAFSLFYSVMGIPIARWADRGNRVTLIAVTTALWSVAVALCGAAGSFVQLLLIRVGVAVGEAGCMPPAHSLIAEYFPRAERARAVSWYMLGVPVGIVIGYFFAGWLNEFYGWRTTFVFLGVPGLGLALLAWLTLKEPRYGKPKTVIAGTLTATEPSSHAAVLSSSHPSMREVLVTLWTNATFRHLLFCYSVMSFFTAGIAQWNPAFFIRSFGLETGELGSWFTAIYGVSGFLGVYLGGELASRAAYNERLQLKAMAVVYCVFGAISACIYLSPNQYLAFGMMALATVGVYMVTGPFFATIQTLVPDRMRAMSIAIIYLFASLIGMGLGPLAAGALSDALRPLVGEESLRYALLSLCPGYLWVAWHLWQASGTVFSDLRIVQPVLDDEPCDENGVVRVDEKI